MCVGILNHLLSRQYLLKGEIVFDGVIENSESSNSTALEPHKQLNSAHVIQTEVYAANWSLQSSLIVKLTFGFSTAFLDSFLGAMIAPFCPTPSLALLLRLLPVSIRI